MKYRNFFSTWTEMLLLLGIIFVTTIGANAPQEQSPQTVSNAIKKLHGQTVNINLNDGTLQNVADIIQSTFNINFITPDIVSTADSKAKKLSDHKVSFASNKPLNAKQALNLFKTFLEIAGFSMVATYDASLFRIITVEESNKAALPTYINIPLAATPNNDTRIRYVYFVVNSTPEQLAGVLQKLRSKTGIISTFPELNAIILTDTAHNVSGLLEIARELDTANVLESLTVMKLKKANAVDVAKIIKSLQTSDDPYKRPTFNFKQQSTLFYFPQDVKLIPSRNNTLIILGPREASLRIENFITSYIDTGLKLTYNPLHVFPLQYAQAGQIAEILNAVIKFGQTPEGQKGGGGERYFAGVIIQPEKESNSLIIKAQKEDYEMLRPIIEELDVQQPQVAIEVLIVSLDMDDLRQVGSQVRTPNSSGNDGSVAWQTSGFFNNPDSKPVVDKASGSLLGNLLELVQTLNKGGASLAGSTLLSFGKTSVWALFGILEQITRTRILSNPFLVATNKYNATVALGETRRVIAQKVIGESTAANQNTFANLDANLEVSVTPQINEYGIINLDISVVINTFQGVDTAKETAGNRLIKNIKTNANVSDGEVLALGGLIKSTNSTNKNGTPILNKIPLIGRLFGNQNDDNSTSNLVVFMSPRIIHPTVGNTGDVYTANKAVFAADEIQTITGLDNPRDPIYRWFFKPAHHDHEENANDYFNRGGVKGFDDKEIHKRKQSVSEATGSTHHAPRRKTTLHKKDEPQDLPPKKKKQSPLLAAVDKKGDKS